MTEYEYKEKTDSTKKLVEAAQTVRQYNPTLFESLCNGTANMATLLRWASPMASQAAM